MTVTIWDANGNDCSILHDILVMSLCKRRLLAVNLMKCCPCNKQLYKLILQLPMQAESSDGACMPASYVASHSM